ncbi:hypothetical protein AWH63_10975 [Marinobacter sp. C18]|uniref:PRTRC system ParB family protein n=1 Tax=Marinobacter sp. C18 TaxID=1772288 RepID=UPI000948F016|nr:PRTRC system ParB family protein [Marinobacter sp. C18]OLF82054.1 hypothetical protein AWH63_10975 [Marinobacter sp. C18]
MTLDATTNASENTSLMASAAEGEYVGADTATEADNGKAEIIDLNRIHKIEGHNPRRIRAKAEIEDIRESIRAKGVLQSVLVRPHPEIEGDFQLVAGETRYDLSLEVGLSDIPALVKNLTDAELLDYATTENIKRASMSPVDEGLAAQRLLADGNDKDEVCRLLGWKPQFFDGRIQLTHCIDEVSQALVDGEIALGHAQLLSGLREESQKNALKATIDKKLSVDALRDTIASLSLTLKAAPFDLTDCQTCPHNSSTQASLFADSKAMGKARCLNKACFDKKTNAHLESVKADLKESFHKVAFSHEIASGTTTVIVPTGSHGVGEEQAKACESCEHFGAVIDSAMGSRAAVTKNTCFNLPCHTKMVKEHRELIATDAQPANEPEQKADTETGKTASTQTTGKTEKPKAKAKATEKKPTVAKSAIPKKIVDLHHQVHRTAAAAHTNDDEKTALIVSLICMMADANIEPDSKPKGWPLSLSGDGRAKAAALLDTLEVAQLQKLQRKMAAKALQKAKSSYGGENEKDSFGSMALWVAETRAVDLTKHFTMDSEYLEPFTKPMIAQRLEESGFAADYDKDKGEKAFSKLANGKKGDLIDAVKESTFKFDGFLPEGLKLKPTK